MFDLGDADRIDEIIKEFKTVVGDKAKERDNDRHVSLLAYSKLQSNLNVSTTNNPGNALRSAIFDPLKSVIGNCKQLIIAPDGDISLVPFEVLPNTDGKTYLINDYHFRYVTTGREIFDFVKEPVGFHSNPIVISDPDFDLNQESMSMETSDTIAIQKMGSKRSRELDPTMMHFERLSGTKYEGQKIAEMLQILGVTQLTGGNVLETLIKSQKSPQILHLATHAFFLKDEIRRHGNDVARMIIIDKDKKLMNEPRWERMDNPMIRSGIALAGANTYKGLVFCILMLKMVFLLQTMFWDWISRILS